MQIDERVRTARMLGKDPELVLHGGGNASLKTVEIDHAGREIKVLRVKGSGSDMATIDVSGFTGLRMDDLLPAEKIEKMTDIEMMDYLRKSMVDPSEPTPSVESFLHAFIPFTFVDHTHSDHILMLTNSGMSEDNISSILGHVLVIPYIPPGFILARQMLSTISKLTPDIKGIVLEKHGLFTFGETATESYEKHMELVGKAREYVKNQCGDRIYDKKFIEPVEVDSILPEIRGKLSAGFKKVLLVKKDGEPLEIAQSSQAQMYQKSGPATPDMLIRTKYDFLYVDNKNNVLDRIYEFATEYRKEHSEYVNVYPMHDPYPSVIIVRGYGIITAARTLKECKIIMDQAVHSMRVNSVAGKLGKQEFISRKEAYEMEYWPLEEAKLKKFRPKPLEGNVCIVTGAASGIGYETFLKISENGGNVIAVDINKDVIKISEEINGKYGVASVGKIVDISDRKAIEKMVEEVVLKYGGIDVLFNNAGILKSEPFEEITPETIEKHIAINSMAPFVLSQKVFTVMKKQGTGGNFIFNITKNLTHPGPGMASYGTTKAFSAQLSHYIAKEGGKFGIRSNIINPDKIFKNSKIWDNGVLEKRAEAKGITPEQYKRGNLLNVEVLPDHVANMVLAILNDDIFGATTDAMIPVDGGII
jgi:rhamnose utilization protein RhaD (predicted bifunctional aldolase and dehydrogenase)/NAD(P)-dependent dehydrogenase (short-subunit alcohol dehydrogenase family)